MTEKVHKFIARSGYTSRRKAEELIKAGHVTVNGRIAHVGERITSADEVRVNQTRITSPDIFTYLKIFKPAGYVCTHRTFQGEHSIFELLPEQCHTLSFAGRLDKDSRGLLLASNDGDWINQLSHPSHKHEKVYRVTLATSTSIKKITSTLETGVTVRGEYLMAQDVTPLDKQTFELTLTYGKKRHIRRMFDSLGLTVTDLVRTRIGEYTLGELQEGEFAKIRY